jgi:hypothetical protein
MLISLATQAAPRSRKSLNGGTDAEHTDTLTEPAGTSARDPNHRAGADEAAGNGRSESGAENHPDRRGNGTPARPGTAGGEADEDGGAAGDNEDYVAASTNAVVLLDGDGGPPGPGSGCSHGVAWYARTLGATLLGALPDTRRSMTSILTDAIAQVGSLHAGTCDLTHPRSPSAAVVMLRRTEDAVDFLVLANAVIVLDIGLPEPMVIHDERPLLAATYGARAMPHAVAGQGPGARAGRDAPADLGTLTDRRYWAASGDPMAAEQALTGSVPACQTRAAALLSDGASRLVDRFGLISWRQFLALLSRHGPDEAIRQTRSAEDSDPAGRRWPRTPLSDDASVAYWEPGTRP